MPSTISLEGAPIGKAGYQISIKQVQTYSRTYFIIYESYGSGTGV